MSNREELIGEILDEWINRVINEVPPDFRDAYASFIKKVAYEILLGEKTTEELVKIVDEKFIEEALRRGVKVKEIAKRVKTLLQVVSEKGDEEFVRDVLGRMPFLQLEIFYKILEVYERVLKEEESRRKRVERALRVLSKVSRAIGEAKSERELLETICRVIVEEGGYAYAWVGYKRKDGKVEPVVKAGEGDYAYEIEVTWDESETGKGPTGTAIRTGKVVVLRNAETERDYSPWREKALKRGYRSSIALPLKVQDEVIGALNIYAYEKDAFDDEEVELLKEVSEVASFGITSVRETEERERLEELYKAIVEGTKSGIIVIRDEKIVYVNEAAEIICGRPKNELVGKKFFEIFSSEDRDKVIKTYRLLSYDQNYVPEDLEVRVQRSDGERVVFLSMSSIEKLNAVVSFILDVTKLREVERKLKEREILYKTIFDSSPLGIVITGIDMSIQDCNEAALKIMERKREDVVGKRWTELGFLDENELYKAIEFFYRGFKGDSSVYEFKITVDGKEKWIKVFTVALTEEGKVKMFLNILEDITEKKKYEKETKEALERLEILRLVDHAVLSGRHVRDAISEALKFARRKLGSALLACAVFGEENFIVYDAEIDVDLTPELFRSEKEKVVEDVLLLKNPTELDIRLMKSGIRSYALYPLVSRDEVVGALLIASRDVFSKEDLERLKFLETLAGQLGIVIREANLFEMKVRSIKQIEENIVTLATLVDKIKNPLAVITLLLEEIEKENVRKKIEEQVKKIMDIVREVEKGWVESENVRRFLTKSWE